MNKIKKVYLKDISLNSILEVEIDISITVKELKDKIERVFNYEPGFLKGCCPIMINRGERVGKILDDDNSPLELFQIKNLCTITFSKTKNVGGGGPPIFFTDVSKGITKEQKLASKAPN